MVSSKGQKFSQHRIKELQPAHPHDYRDHHTVHVPTEQFNLDWLKNSFDSIDEYLNRWNVKTHRNCRYQQIKAELTHANEKFSNINLQRFYMAMRDLSIFMAAIQTLGNDVTPPPMLRRALSEDPLVPQAPTNRSPGRDLLFELFVGAFFRAAGCDAEVAEPDYQCSYYSLKFGAAAKRCSLTSIGTHIKKARDQIANTGKRGMILIDVSHNDQFNWRKIFVGTREDYTRHVHIWMAENIVKPLQRRARHWKIYGENIPGIFSFYFGIYYDPKDDRFNLFHHFSVYSVEYSRELTPDDWHEDYIFNKLIFALRSTLPGAGVTLPPVNSTAPQNCADNAPVRT